MLYFFSIVILCIVYRLYSLSQITQEVNFSYFTIAKEDLPDTLPCY